MADLGSQAVVGQARWHNPDECEDQRVLAWGLFQ